MSRAWYRGLVAAGIVWLGLLWGVPAAKQALVFYEGGAAAFCDYRMPQTCVASEKVYEPEGMSRVDAPYPAFGYVVAKAFPADVLKGGMLFTAFSLLVFFWGVWLFARDGWAMAAVVFMSPVLHAIGVGNQIVLTLGGVLVFLAWKDERGWKKGVAFLALAAAAALKIVPAAFGLTLVKKRRGRDCVLLAALGAVLMFVPFAWVGGTDGFAAFLQNVRLHSEHYGPLGRYGFVPFDRSLRLLMGLPKESVQVTFWIDRVLSLALGLACLWRWWRTRNRAEALLMLGAVILLVPSVTQFYSAMYVLPAVLLGTGACADRRTWTAQTLLLFAAFCPLQIPFANGGLSMLVTNGALVSLFVLALARPRDGLRLLAHPDENA